MKMLGFNMRWRAPERFITVEDYRQAASRRVPRMVWSYIDGGAGAMDTLRGNQAGFDAWMLRSRILTGHAKPDLRTSVAGVPLEMPVLFAPTGYLGLTNWRGDLEVARAAEAMGTRYVVSTASSWTVEEIAATSPVGHFFQLYPREGGLGARLMRRAWDAGYRVMMATVDVPVVGNRVGERKNGMGMPPTLTPRRMLNVARHPRWLFDVLRHQRIGGRNLVNGGGIAGAIEAAEMQSRHMVQATLNWDDLAWMRDQWKGALFVKGVLDPEDAVRAVSLGAEGVVVSNHGGRQLNHAVPSIAALPDVVAAIGDRAEVLLDGGVRHGSDVIKAIALGARAVMIGRPYVYGVAVDGGPGAQDVLRILRTEMTRDLTLMGCAGVDRLDHSWVLPGHAATVPARSDAGMSRAGPAMSRIAPKVVA